MTITNERLEMVCGGNDEVRQELVGLFIAAIERTINILSGLDGDNANTADDTENHDSEKYRTALHELKGAAQNLGFDNISDICLTAESLPYTAQNTQNVISNLQTELQEMGYPR